MQAGNVACRVTGCVCTHPAKAGVGEPVAASTIRNLNASSIIRLAITQTAVHHFLAAKCGGGRLKSEWCWQTGELCEWRHVYTTAVYKCYGPFASLLVLLRPVPALNDQSSTSHATAKTLPTAVQSANSQTHCHDTSYMGMLVRSPPPRWCDAFRAFVMALVLCHVALEGGHHVRGGVHGAPLAPRLTGAWSQ